MKHKWYPRGKFLPREIDHDRSYKALSKGGHKVYRFLCFNSYVRKNSPARRYSVWSYAQIAGETGLSRSHVGRLVRELVQASLVRRWYAGDSGSKRPGKGPRPPRYELPASIGMIAWWRVGERKRR